MKRALFLFLSCATFVTASPGGGGRLIYWKPIQQDVNFATIDGQQQFLGPDYSWGWQADGNFFMEENSFFGNVNLVSIVSKASAVATTIGEISSFGTTGDDGSVEIFAEQRYHGGDGVVGHHFLERPYLTLDLYGGFRYISLKSKQESRLTLANPVGFDLQRAWVSFHGGGPILGVGAHAELCWGFGAAGKLAFSLPVGSRQVEGNRNRTIAEATASRASAKETTIFPGVDGSFFINYTVCGAWMEITAEAGYEMREFFGALWRARPADASGTQPLDLQSFGFAGPYVALRGSF